MDPKEKLGKALYHLLEKKHLHDITVDEIVRDVGLKQEDFDRYCKSKKELAHWVYLHILARHGRDILKSRCWSEALYKKFLLYKANLKFLQNLYTSCDVEEIRQTNRRFVRDAYHLMLKKAGADLKNPHIQFATEMVIYGGEEMTMRWILEGMEVPIEVMLVLFQESIPLIISQYFY